MRNPNGINIRKLSGQRRKPYQARKLIGYSQNDETRRSSPLYKTIGYFATRKEALEAIMEYDRDPLSFDASTITFEELYARFSEKKFSSISEKTAKNYRAAYRFFAPVYQREFRSLRADDYEAVITEDVPRTQRTVCKILLDQMYQYALKNDIVNKNVGKLVDFREERGTVLKREVFTSEQLETLWEYSDDTAAAMAIIGIYSGFRPGELAIIKTDNVHIEEGYIQEGIKTAAGKDRIVPIHDKIKDLVAQYYDKACKKGAKQLFTLSNGNNMSVEYYSHSFRILMKNLGWNHMPHDTRHTFITAARRSGMRDDILKRIVGHKIADITSGTYTHITLDELKTAINTVEI